MFQCEFTSHVPMKDVYGCQTGPQQELAEDFMGTEVAQYNFGFKNYLECCASSRSNIPSSLEIGFENHYKLQKFKTINKCSLLAGHKN